MSDRERPEAAALRDLEVVVRHLGDELATFRRRALTAEARVRDFEVAAGAGPIPHEELARLRERIEEVEAENAGLRARLEAAAGRTKQMLDRVHFLRQQAQGSDR